MSESEKLDEKILKTEMIPKHDDDDEDEDEKIFKTLKSISNRAHPEMIPKHDDDDDDDDDDDNENKIKFHKKFHTKLKPISSKKKKRHIHRRRR